MNHQYRNEAPVKYTEADKNEAPVCMLNYTKPKSTNNIIVFQKSTGLGVTIQITVSCRHSEHSSLTELDNYGKWEHIKENE